MAAPTEDKLGNVSSLLEKFDSGLKKYLDWIGSVKSIDGKVPVKVEHKSELNKWRSAFSEVAKKSGIHVSFSKEHCIELQFLDFGILVHLSNRASVESVSLHHPSIDDAELDVCQLLKSPHDVAAVMGAFVDILKSMQEAARDERSEMSKILTGLISLYADLDDTMCNPNMELSMESVLSSRYGHLILGRSCFLRPNFVYYCHPIQLPSVASKNLTEFCAHVSFQQSPSSFSLQVAHNNVSNVFTYSSVSGVFVLVLDKPVLVCSAIFRKLQDLCRKIGMLQYLKSTDASDSSLPSMRESSPVFPRALLSSQVSERFMQNLGNRNVRLAISVVWEKLADPKVFDPCHWVEAIPFCDTKNLTHIIHLLRLQQRFNTVLMTSCAQSLPKEKLETIRTGQVQRNVCVPINIMVNSLTSFSLKCRHPIENKFLICTVSFSRELDANFNEPKIFIQSQELLFGDAPFETVQSFSESVSEVFKTTWSLSAVAAFIWEYFLPASLNSSLIKDEKVDNNSLAMSPSFFGEESSVSKVKRVSILEEILDEAESANANAAAANASQTAQSTSLVGDLNYSPNTHQRLIKSSCWLPNSSNIASFEPPAATAPSSLPIRTAQPTHHATRGRPRKNPVVPATGQAYIPSSNSTSVRSPAAASTSSTSSKKRPSLPPLNESNDQDMALLSPNGGRAGKQQAQPVKRGRRISTSPSASSPGMSMQQSPAGSRHGNEYFLSHLAGGGSEHHQSNTPMAMTPAFSFPSEYGGNEESEESCVQSTPSDEKLPNNAVGEGASDTNMDDNGFPSPPVLVQEMPARPASEEDEKGLVICEPGGYDTSPVFDEGRNSPSTQLLPNRVPSATSLSRPSSGLSDHLRLGSHHRLHQRVILSSDESEQSSSNSIPEDRGLVTTKAEPANISSSRYNTGLSPGFSSSSTTSAVDQSPRSTLTQSLSATGGKLPFSKPGTTKLLALNDIFHLGEEKGPINRQQAKAALDRVLFKNTSQEEDAFAFNDRDPVPNQDPKAALAAVRPAKRPAPSPSSTTASSSSSKPVVKTTLVGGSQRQRTISDDQRSKQPKQRKIEGEMQPQLGSASSDLKKTTPGGNSSSAKPAALAEFSRPLPTNMKIPKKPATTPTGGTPEISASGNASKSSSSSSQSMPKNGNGNGNGGNGSSKSSSSSSSQQNVATSALASVANPLSSFRIPKKKDTGGNEGSGSSSAKESHRDSSSKRPAASPSSHQSSSSSSKSSQQPAPSPGSGGGTSGGFRQRTNSFDGGKDKPVSSIPGASGVPEPTPIPLSASYPQVVKAGSEASGRSLQHHKSQPEFPGPGAPSGDSSSSDPSRRKSGAGDSSRQSSSSSSSQRRPSGQPRSSGGPSSQQPSRSGAPSSASSSLAQRNSFGGSDSRRPPPAAPYSGEPYAAAGGPAGSTYPQPPPAHQRLPSSSSSTGGRAFPPAHSSSTAGYTGDYSYSGGNGGGGGGVSSSGGGGGAGSTWYDNNYLGGSNYRSFSDQAPGEAPIQSPEPYGQPHYDNQPPIIIATSPVRHHPPSSHNSSGNNSNNYY